MIDRLAAEGVEHTQVTETLTMASANDGEPLLISVKAVDPAVYPFYGTVKLDPSRGFARGVHARSVAVSDGVLLRLNAHLGDTIASADSLSALRPGSERAGPDDGQHQCGSTRNDVARGSRAHRSSDPGKPRGRAISVQSSTEIRH